MSTQTITYNFSGVTETFIVPPCVTTLTVIVVGAGGGASRPMHMSYGPGLYPEPSKEMDSYVVCPSVFVGQKKGY